MSYSAMAFPPMVYSDPQAPGSSLRDELLHFPTPAFLRLAGLGATWAASEHPPEVVLGSPCLGE